MTAAKRPRTDPPDDPRANPNGCADTSDEVTRRMRALWLERTPGERLRHVFALNEAVGCMVDAGLRVRHGADLDSRELRLRRAALWLDHETLRRATGWDPETAAD